MYNRLEALHTLPDNGQFCNLPDMIADTSFKKMALSHEELFNSEHYILLMEILNEEKKQENSFELCSICTERAGKHNYYGGRCCPSCRAFFRRSVTNNMFESFYCVTGNENCVIRKENRKTCQYCRFKKCLCAGMKTQWVLPNGEKNNKKKNFPVAPVPIPKYTPNMNITNEEVNFITKIVNFCYRDAKRLLQSYILQEKVLWSSFLSYIQNPKPHQNPYNIFDIFCELRIRDFINFSQTHFHPIDTRDRLKLSQANYPIMRVIKYSTFIDDDLKCTPLKALLHSDFCSQPEILQVIEIRHLFRRLDDFSLNEKQRFLDILHRIQIWSSSDVVLAILLNIIIFYNTDFISGLIDQRTIDHIKIEISHIFYKYCRSKYCSKGASIFNQGLWLIAEAKEAHELYNKICLKKKRK